MTKGNKILSLFLNDLTVNLSNKFFTPKAKPSKNSSNTNSQLNHSVSMWAVKGTSRNPKSYLNSNTNWSCNAKDCNSLSLDSALDLSRSICKIELILHNDKSRFLSNCNTKMGRLNLEKYLFISNSWWVRSFAQPPRCSTGNKPSFLNCDQQVKRCYSIFKHNNIDLCLITPSFSKNHQKLSLRNVRKTTGHQDISDPVSMSTNEVKHKLRDPTKTLHSKISKLKKSIILQKCKLKDRWKAQQIRSLQTVGKLKRTLKAKKENIKTVPNLLTTMRMASAPALAYLVVHNYFGTACTIFVLAGITDLLDGYIARNFKNQRTALGTALDPLADKLLVSFLGISLTSVGLIPVPMTVLILSRDFGLILASFYIRYISLPPPKTVSRYFDVSLVTAKLYPSTVSKINTGLQLSYVAATLASPVFNFVDHPWLQGLMYLTAATTFISGVDYVLTWRRRLKIIPNK